MKRFINSTLTRGGSTLLLCILSFLLITTTTASAQNCPSFATSGSGASVDANSLWAPQSFSVTAGGNIDLSACGSVPGHGFIIESPDFTIGYNNLNMGRDLEIRVNGSCDTVLLVNDANGQWHFSDDENGTMDPSLRIGNAPSGSYDIWVGTFSQGTCGATMVMETFGGTAGGGGGGVVTSPPSLAACPSFASSGSGASVDANSLWAPQSFSVTAGGNIDLSACGSVPGHGFIIESPDFTIGYNNLNMGRDLEIRVNGSCDTVLLVNDANGQWHFSDDENGTMDPSLRIGNAPSGSYDIWVGTFSQGTCGATMVMETFGGIVVQQPAPPPPVVSGGKPGNATPPAPPPVFTGQLPDPFSRVVLPDPGNLTAWNGRFGEIVHFQVTGSLSGSIWGDGIYSDDSTLSVAAVHAGVLAVGQTGIVSVVIRPGEALYDGTMFNGVQSMSFGQWSGSYSFLAP